MASGQGGFWRLALGSLGFYRSGLVLRTGDLMSAGDLVLGLLDGTVKRIRIEFLLVSLA